MLILRESRLFRRRRSRFIAVLAATAVVAVLAFLGAQRVNQTTARATTVVAASGRAQAAASLIASELQKYRLLPLVLSDYPDVQHALLQRSGDKIAKLNARLELIADRTDASAIYVMDATGKTIAASNWRLPTSFVGQDYQFRPYFRRAVRDGSAEQFALGTVSHKPGLYLARRTANGHGVVVVKLEFGSIESSWANQAGPTIVRDANGVVIMASQPDWRLRATRILLPEIMAAIRTAKLYGNDGPRPLAPDLTIGLGDGSAVDNQQRRYMMATTSIPVGGWTLTTLEPLAPAMAAANARTLIAALTAALVMVIGLGLFARSREARNLRQAAQLELERQVELRTAELRGVNQQLVHESIERERNEARLREAREELAQSNRLATLGQISAGVAHEINQPLAALRTFAENAAVMLTHGRAKDAGVNLDHIVQLSERIGDITGELRTFARREASKGPARLDEAIDGALLLIGDRLRQHVISVERHGDSQKYIVAADRVRIEQILLNLLQNAMDACASVENPTISILISSKRKNVEIEIGDNGIGITPKMQADLFKSFATEKSNGLGLGLVISRDLAREVGGELTHEPGRREVGATFLLRLPLS